MPWNPDGTRKSSTYKMKYSNSAFPFKTPDFSDAKQVKLYETSKEYRDHLKSQGITYDSKTKLGRWLMGRKKHTLADGSTVITDKEGKVVKTKYKKGNRPMYHGL